MSLTDFLAQLAGARGEHDVVLATMTPAFLWPTVSTSDLDYCYVAPMGSVGPLGLGLALAQPDRRVIVIDGDGSLLMNLGALVTIGAQAPANLVHVVVDNDGYAITGGQPLPGRGGPQIRDLAAAADYREVHEIADPGALSSTDVERIRTVPGPVLLTAHVETVYDRSTLPDLTHSAKALATQGPAGYHNLRAALTA
ncbi:hypothetical protein GCM10009836_19020 [Pseudonocardia ailaonensis]|uniref:Thiamine pyrophosphate enzyme TPP-binding domain-containing protein n=1 Tax=Pseudonocardia ailaonensis TaxID=367279 RepID=A0ABN2MXA8_9PSEU